VKSLRPGQGCYAALITAKGKMQSDLNIFCLQDELLLDFEPGLTSKIVERLEKFVIADDVQIVDAAPHYGLLAVNGPRAAEVMRGVRIFGELPEKPLSFLALEQPGLGLFYLVNHPRTGTAGFDVFVPNPALGTTAHKLATAAEAIRGRTCGWAAFEIARIEAGIPRFGADMDDSILPLEAGLEARAISFNKGCYIGQEVISRIRTYGQVTKALRGLRLDEKLQSLPAKGARLFKDGKEAGYVTSAASSPTLNAKIALGYVRKEVNRIGTDLILQFENGEFSARVASLPFVQA
jgi:folate-binding protein YgfZ